MKLPWSAVKEDFNFNRVPEVYFWKGQWEAFDPHDHDAPVSALYFFYRFLYLAWFIGATIHVFVCGKDYDTDFYFIFLTNQSFTFQLIYAALYFLYILWVVWRKYRQHSNSSFEIHKSTFHDDDYKLPIICKVIWIMISIQQVVPYIVTSIYWIFLYGDDNDQSTCNVVNNLLVHGLNSPLALLDLFIIAVPLRSTHVIFPIIAGLWYSFFSGFYELFGGQYAGDREYIYPILNWKNKPGSAALTCVGALFGAVVVYFIMWGLYKLRILIKSKCTKISELKSEF